LKSQKEFFELLASEIVKRAKNNRYIFIFGNGGSASTASHFACNISKNYLDDTKPKPRLMCLSDNISMLTAWANDKAYEDVFIEPLKVYLQADDLVIAISGSGNSPNVIKAINYAKSINAKTFGLCGFNGGKLAKCVDHSIIVPADYMEQVEDVHLFILHLTSLLVIEKLKKL
jgi:D-sedoheptulose 7-phosphate isomerase